MYGHQIIEDLRQWKDPGIPSLIDEIKPAHHFYIPEELFSRNFRKYGQTKWLVPEVPGPNDPYEQCYILPHSGFDPNLIRLPYSPMLIMYSYNNRERGYLQTEHMALILSDLFLKSTPIDAPWRNIRIMSLRKLFGKWEPMPIWICMKISQEFDKGIGCIFSQAMEVSEPVDTNRAIAGTATLCKADMAMVVEFLSLLHCKNIVTLNNLPPDKLQKKRIKSGKQPLFTYKTLAIKIPGERKGETVTEPLFTGIHQRIHTCRGTFRTYSAARPLFGKLTGTYWVPAHVRGRNRDGLVQKDYHVTI